MLTLIDIVIMGIVCTVIYLAYWAMGKSVQTRIELLELELALTLNAVGLIGTSQAIRHDIMYAEFQLQTVYYGLDDSAPNYIEWLQRCIEAKSMTAEDLQ